METYNFSLNQRDTGMFRKPLCEGLPLREDEKLGSVLFLGEQGRGRHFEKLSLDRHNPPETRDDNRVYNCNVKKITPKNGGRTFFTLVQSRNQDNRILLRVSCEGTYTRNTKGRIEVLQGDPKILIEAHGAYGAAGRTGTWKDYLMVLHPEDVIKILPSGGSKKQKRWAVTHTGDSLDLMEFKDWELTQEGEEEIL